MSPEERIEDKIEHGKVEISRILREKLEEENISLQTDRPMWWTVTSENPSKWRLTVRSTTGSNGDQEFSLEHLTKMNEDNRVLVRVHAKITSIVLQLKGRE